MPEYYRIFNTTLSSEFPLPGLPQCPRDARSLSVKMGRGDPVQVYSSGFVRAFEWQGYDDDVICWCERRGDEYLFEFPRHATFHISDGLISCFLHETSSMQTLCHLLLNQIIPRYLATSGLLILHAGAVTLENGKSVAFLGNSGFGKSTLVSSFHRHGAQLINDDCILLECSEDGVTATGGLFGIRLLPDSVEAVFAESVGFTDYTPYTEKQQLYLKDQSVDGLPGSCVLDAIFLLNDPKEEIHDKIRIEPVSGSHALVALIYSAFSLDPSDKKMISSNFQNVGQVISDRMDVFSLKYPRQHDLLHEVRKAVYEQVT